MAACLLFWVFVFTIYFAAQGTTPLEFLFGRYEPLPEGLGQWRDVGVDRSTGLMRQERFLAPEGRSGTGRLLHQVRYRNVVTGNIERVEPEQRVSRRRISTRS